MKRAKKQSLLILFGAIILVFLISFTSVKVYRVALQETKAKHQVQQIALAKAASTGLDYWLRHFEEEMKILSSLPAIQYFDLDNAKYNLDYFFQHIKHQGVENIVIYTRDGRAAVSSSDVFADWMQQAVKERLLDFSAADSFSNWYSDVQPLGGKKPKKMCFIALTPVRQYYKDSRYASPSGQFVGAVCYLINFDWLVQQHVAPLEITDLDFIWLIDEKGRLLYHSHHPEMQKRSLFDSTKTCTQCHSNFIAQREILKSGSGIKEYRVGAEPVRLMAYSSVNMGNLQWYVVLSTLQAKTIALLQSKFRFFFIHVGVIIVIILISGWLLYYFNAKRIRAEEEQRRAEEHKELQEQIDHAAKLASIGELVDSVAHEINTPTSIISMQADAILMQAEKQDGIKNDLKLIKEQTRRIHKYTRSLLDFSRRMPFRPRPTDICQTVDHCLFLIGHRFRAQKIKILKKYDQDLPQIAVDPGQIEQVVINILNNAVDAIEERGRIEIAISLIHLDGKKYINLIFEDNGPGIAPETITEIFNAFYTTKEGAKGTGLGLSISRAIIQRHRGQINVESALGTGSRFIIKLPVQLTEESN